LTKKWPIVENVGWSEAIRPVESVVVPTDLRERDAEHRERGGPALGGHSAGLCDCAVLIDVDDRRRALAVVGCCQRDGASSGPDDATGEHSPPAVDEHRRVRAIRLERNHLEIAKRLRCNEAQRVFDRQWQVSLDAELSGRWTNLRRRLN